MPQSTESNSICLQSLQDQITTLMSQLEKTKSDAEAMESRLCSLMADKETEFDAKFRNLEETCYDKVAEVLDEAVSEMTSLTSNCFLRAIPKQSDEQKALLEDCCEQFEERAEMLKEQMKAEIYGSAANSDMTNDEFIHQITDDQQNPTVQSEDNTKILHLRKGFKVAADPLKKSKRRGIHQTKKVPSINVKAGTSSQADDTTRNQPLTPPRQQPELLFPPELENRSSTTSSENQASAIPEGELFRTPPRDGTSPSLIREVTAVATENISATDGGTTNEEDTVQTPFITQTRRAKKEKTTPIIIKDERYTWAQLKEMIKSIGQEGFTGKVIADGFNIKSKNQDQQRAITALLNEKKVKYHSFTLPDDKFIKVVIRGLPITTSTDEIQSDLLAAGFVVKQVAQLTKRRDGDKVPMPLFLVTLTQTEMHEQIHHHQYILDLRVKIEEYRGREGPSQCHKCQEFGHTQRNCGRPPRCVKCTTDDHFTADCPKEKEDLPQCCNCKGQHTANWPGCPAFPKDVQSKKHPPAIIPTRATRVFTNASIPYTQALTGLTPQQPPAITQTPITTPTQSISAIDIQTAIDTTTQLKELIDWLKEKQIVELLHTLKDSLTPRLPTGTQQPTNA